MAPNTSQSSDEIDLQELFISLWQAKLLILGITVFVTCIAAAYAFLSPPIYEASSRLLPPKTNDLVSYNTASQLTGGASTANQATNRSDPWGIPALTTKDAYSAFLQNLDSDNVKLRFFNEYYLPAVATGPSKVDNQKLWKRLNSVLTIDLPKKTNDVAATVSFEGTNPAKIVEWANGYVNIAASVTQKNFLQDLEGEVNVRAEAISEQIAALRTVAKTQRELLIVRTEAALAIAQSIGLDSPSPEGPIVSITNAGSNDSSRLSDTSMMYLRGTKALNSELKLLKARQNDDAYIAGLDELLKRKNLLSSIDLNPAHLAVMSVDRAAELPSEPIKPKKALVLGIGFILGVMLGIFVAVMRQALRR